MSRHVYLYFPFKRGRENLNYCQNNLDIVAFGSKGGNWNSFAV